MAILMLSYKKVAHCPVCPNGENFLGYIVRGEVCTYLCDDCQFLYTWDSKGKLLAPVKYKQNKRATKYCDSNGCYCH